MEYLRQQHKIAQQSNLVVLDGRCSTLRLAMTMRSWLGRCWRREPTWGRRLMRAWRGDVCGNTNMQATR
jgi:hypothetical protein